MIRIKGDFDHFLYNTLRICGQYEKRSMERARRPKADSFDDTRETKQTEAAKERLTDNIVETLQKLQIFFQ